MPLTAKTEIIVAGHICLDIIPEIPADTGANLIEPGKLLTIGPIHYATGGVVSNVGIALHKLGLSPRLIGKVGNDLFGRTIIEYFQSFAATLPQNISVSDEDSTSYTIVVNPPGRDRTFWHHPGCNDSFGVDDIDMRKLSGARLFHFGYPPIMQRLYSHNGVELVELFRRVKDAGLITSLDMAFVDPNSPAGKVNWNKILDDLLPFVDIFLPSLDEIICLIGTPALKQLYGTNSSVNELILGTISGDLLKRGAAIVGLKLGRDGFYLRTTTNQQRLATLLPNAAQWEGRELLSACFQVREKGTTGSGDCTIAGFLAGLIKGLSPENTINSAVGAGACSVETLDATSGIPDWNTLQKRIESGWEKHPVNTAFENWHWNKKGRLLCGPNDNFHAFNKKV
jgi:sugar/nucleoside kinase (ribokinase family)